MKTCPKCGAACDDSAVFCVNCGQPMNEAGAPQQQAAPVYQQPIPPSDHTAEFDPRDISENKVLAMVPYVMGWIGIIVALLAINNSKYVSFHVKQVMKLKVCSTLLLLIGGLLVWTVLVPIAALIAEGVLAVIQIIGFFWVCFGKAKELPIIRSFGFLK